MRRVLLALAGFAVIAVVALALQRAERTAPAVPTPLLARHGCDTCHAPGAPYHARLRLSAARSEAEVVERILHADRFDANRRMPVYAGTLSEAQARALAAEVQAVGKAMPQREP
jgi:mono/diheme cytochrome c family protein